MAHFWNIPLLTLMEMRKNQLSLSRYLSHAWAHYIKRFFYLHTLWTIRNTSQYSTVLSWILFHGITYTIFILSVLHCTVFGCNMLKYIACKRFLHLLCCAILLCSQCVSMCCLAERSTVFHYISLHCVVTKQVYKGLKDYTHPRRRCQKWASRTHGFGLI